MTDMLRFYLIADGDSLVQAAQWLSEAVPQPEGTSIHTWAGHLLAEIPGTKWDRTGKQLDWNGTAFFLEEFSPMPGLRLILGYQRSLREQLLEGALNQIPDSIQIYDAAGGIRFFNAATKRLLEFSPQETVEGQRLLDVFDVDPDYSTTLTALRTRSAVRGRFDRYKSTTGKELSTVTSALPIMQGDVLLGVLSLERDMKIVQRLLNEYQPVQQTLLHQLSKSLSKPKNTRYTLDDLVGNCPELLAAKELAAKMAGRDTNILLQGETGTGKEIFAQGIHTLSGRSNGKFVAVNCAAFPETLIEGMLFGTVKGAFTGSTDKAGLIEEANHGTLFLDEMNSMSLGMQAKLLRVLQEKTVQRVGSAKNIPVDVRVISSCNEDAFALSENGTLRKDLFYRLASVIIEIPPVRERGDDLALLAWHYIRQNDGVCPQPITEVTPGFWSRLQRHSWPGNVRELFHILYYAINDCEDGVLREENLPVYFLSRSVEKAPPQPTAGSDEPEPDYTQGLSALVREYERTLLRNAYLSCEKNATKAAELLKISRQNFQYYLKKYDLNR